ncbi:MAG: hypothetical protein MRY32_00250 [Rickettsiales bacterium]|nr:hypothetical protein [Rickettsiales bacterium]
MQAEEFTFISDLLKQRSGLSLTEDKMYLLQSRLQPIARSHQMDSVEALVRHIRSTNDANLIHEVTQSMTTNETMFFRDNKPFDCMKRVVLPALKEASPAMGKIRIWSSACSAGQEPYSLAITLEEEKAKYPGLDYEIVATDLCEKVVQKAKDGIYTQFEVQRGLPIQMMIKYFEQADNNQWKVKDDLKRKISFSNHNLLENYTKFGRFDIIFCRNVLIYFDEKTKGDILDRMGACLNPPGFLFLGSAESTMGLTEKFKQNAEERSVHQLK